MRGRLSTMTLIKPINGEVTSDCVTAAEQLFEEAIQAVAGITGKIKRKDAEALADLKPAVPNATAATKLLLQEVGRVHELHKKKNGVVYDFAIDFDAARAEIRSRLACLRAAGDS